MTPIASAFHKKYRSTGQVLAQVLAELSLDLVSIVAEYAKEVRLVESITVPRMDVIWASTRLLVSPSGEMLISNTEKLTTYSRSGQAIGTWNARNAGFHSLHWALNRQGDVFGSILHRELNRDVELVTFSSPTDYHTVAKIASSPSALGIACVGEQILIIYPEDVHVISNNGATVAHWTTWSPRRSDTYAISKQGYLCFLDYTNMLLIKHDIHHGYIKESISLGWKPIGQPVPFWLDSNTDQFAVLFGKHLSGATVRMCHPDGSLRHILEFATRIVDCCYDVHGKFYVLMNDGCVQVYDE